MTKVVSLSDMVKKQMQLNPLIPQRLHKNYEDVICKMTNYYKSDPWIFAVVLCGSLARGQGVAGSCIDLVVFVKPQYYTIFFDAKKTRKRIAGYSRMGGKIHCSGGVIRGNRKGQEWERTIKFNDIRVDLAFVSDVPRSRDQFGICMDGFELEIGNDFVYCLPLYERDDTYKSLARKYLPYYGDDIRKERLEATRKEFEDRIKKAKWLAERGLLFNALSTLQFSSKIFLQHLFIKRRVYPIKYDKWVKYQIVDILHEPELYKKLVEIHTIPKLTNKFLMAKADLLHNLMQKYGDKYQINYSKN